MGKEICVSYGPGAAILRKGEESRRKVLKLILELQQPVDGFDQPVCPKGKLEAASTKAMVKQHTPVLKRKGLITMHSRKEGRITRSYFLVTDRGQSVLNSGASIPLD